MDALSPAERLANALWAKRRIALRKTAGAAEAQKDFADPLRQILEVAERVSLAGDKIALAVLDVCERAEAIDL